MFVNFCNNSSSSNNNNYLLSEKATIRANIGDCFAPDLDKFAKFWIQRFNCFEANFWRLAINQHRDSNRQLSCFMFTVDLSVSVQGVELKLVSSDLRLSSITLFYHHRGGLRNPGSVVYDCRDQAFAQSLFNLVCTKVLFKLRSPPLPIHLRFKELIRFLLLAESNQNLVFKLN